MNRRLRGTRLVLHIATSVGLLGAVAAFPLLATLAVAGPDPSAYPALDVLARRLILPLSLASAGIGLALGVLTPCGLVTHRWVLAKLALSLLVIPVLVAQPDGIRTAATATPEALGHLVGLRWSFVVHAAGGAAVLIAALVLSVFKPLGRTPWSR
jgi:hypothetical protein